MRIDQRLIRLTFAVPPASVNLVIRIPETGIITGVEYVMIIRGSNQVAEISSGMASAIRPWIRTAAGNIRAFRPGPLSRVCKSFYPEKVDSLLFSANPLKEVRTDGKR